MSAAAKVLVLFEDEQWRSLRPLSDLTAVFDLAFGASTIAGRWHALVERRHPGAELFTSSSRPTLASSGTRRGKAPNLGSGNDSVLLVNAAALPGPWVEGALADTKPRVLRSGDRLVGAWVSGSALASLIAEPGRLATRLAESKLPESKVDAALIEWPWDLVVHNPEAIAADLAGMKPARQGEVHPSAVLLEPQNVLLDAGARVDPLAVLDARPGPIWIRSGARVASHTVVTGPCVVGERTQLLGGSIGGSTIGPECRIAGEVDSSIWQGWSNKRHHGFVGHSVVGEWCNLGALTTTSDLKNNYGTVRVWVDGRERESGQIKVGSFLGVAARTGIGTLLPTGASIGAGSNLFGGGRYAPKLLPAFSWWDGVSIVENRFDKFLVTARTAMSRRGRELGASEERALRALFESTASERGTPIPAATGGA